MNTSYKMLVVMAIVVMTSLCASAQSRIHEVDSLEVSKDRNVVTYVENGKKVILYRNKHVKVSEATEQLKTAVADTLVDAHGYRATDNKSFSVTNHKYFLQDGEVQIMEKRTKWEQKNTSEMTFEEMKSVVDGSVSAVDYKAKDLLHRNLAHFQIGVSGGASYMTKSNFIMPMAGVNIDIHGRKGFVFGVDAGCTFLNPYLEGTVGAAEGVRYEAPYFGARVGHKFWFNRNKNSYISPTVMGRFVYTRSDVLLEDGGATGTYAPCGGVMLESGFVFAEHFVVKANVWGHTGTTLPHNSVQDWKNVTVGASVGVAVLLHFQRK
jgi:hypothetical protein